MNNSNQDFSYPQSSGESDENLSWVSASGGESHPQQPQRNTPQPIVTYTLLGLSIIIYLLQMATETVLGIDLPAAIGIKVNEYIASGQIWRLITPVLLHGSILHIGFNMYALYLFGRGMENNFGHGRFLALYLLSGFAGNVFSMMFTDAPSLGSSTAIFGLMGAHGVFIYQNRSLFGKQATRQSLSRITRIAAINLIIGLSPGIDNWGHVGGLLGGTIFAWFGGPVLIASGSLLISNGTYAPIIADKRESGDVLQAIAITGGFFASIAAVAIYLMK